MEKQKRWQLYLIITVLALTLYNILPTIFYYSNPLKEPINATRAEDVSISIIDRVNSLEDDSQAWLASFCKLLHLNPISIELKPDDPRLFEITFQNSQDASIFKRFLPAAGERIPFVPAQLELAPGTSTDDPNTVIVARQIDVHLNPDEVHELFHFSPKIDHEGQITKLYRDIVYDRTTQVALGFGGPSKAALQLAAVTENTDDPQFDRPTITLSKEIVDLERTFGKDHPITKRYFASFTQIDLPNRDNLPQKFITRIETVSKHLDKERAPLVEEKQKSGQLETSQEEKLALLNNQHETLEKAKAIVGANRAAFKAGQKPLKATNIQNNLAASGKNLDPKDPQQVLNLEGRNPLVEALVVDWSNDTVEVKFYDDVQRISQTEGVTEEEALMHDKLRRLLINDIARVSRLSDEAISPDVEGYSIALNPLKNMQSFLTFDLSYLAQKQVHQVNNTLITSWLPKHQDLANESYPIMDYDTYQTLSSEEQKLGLIVYAPGMYQEAPPAGFKTDSVYVIAKGLNNIMEKYRETPEAPEHETLITDINNLGALLQTDGFIGYSGASYGIAPEFKNDFIFELDDYYSPLIKATRENFAVKGSKRFGVLNFSNVEQRILTRNKIDDLTQEDLVKWYDDYEGAQADIDATKRYLIPHPTKNPYYQNLKLSFAKYFRGDDRKILKWGLDLSGGKTVRIGLRDHNNRRVTNPDDLKQAVNELYTRINKMGVSERTIRIENDNIILEFPGSQELSATDLVQASAMYFHIVNEKFSLQNPNLRDTVNQFLQNVWNEAVVTNRKDISSINEIAWEHLGGDVSSGREVQPKTEYAKLLHENGLILAHPREATIGHAFNDTLSSIAMLRGEDFSQWEGQSHPLMIVFHNYALEGSSLTDVRVGYDPTQGNLLSFGVKNSYEGTQTGSPRDDFYSWTSQFAEDQIQGTPKEVYSQGRGWRMAVILNNTVISSPSLRAALRDGGTITGRFSQREINQLAADLKAGSLSFTPHILSEQNISPELGLEERTKGIAASGIALGLVFIAMIAYYRFAGLVASCAVFLNILIMWGVLQNLGAAITLPGIAGIVLTIGMAVDANVLVFERVREEFKISGRIASAIQAGYRKAFSAIIDSNVTTIIAALILTQFDSGPIKGFAITLIIGILSSMFTALFMTRYFFAGWVRNPKHKHLTMSQLIGNTKFDFLGQARKAFAISILVMVVGSYLFVSQRNTIFGMDFTGGYSLTVELDESPDTQYRLEADEALLAAGATPNDFQIRELSRPNQLQIQLGIGMEEQGHPFYGLPETASDQQYAHEYERNPRIMWIVDALGKKGLHVQESDLEDLHRNWTVMSGQFSETMRDNALIALGFALISILIYITLRFEFKYAIGAVIGLTHDVIITLGILALFHKLGFPVQIDLEIIGAIMTIIGYSLNDTIVIFDRIREDLKVMRKVSFKEVVNHALNVTLSRTVMTSTTTLLVLMALVVLGGWSIFGFSLVMTIGVVVGTLSSLFIAGPVMLYFHNREVRQQKVTLKKA